MVPALKTPRQQHALGGVLSKMRGEILRQGPGCGPSLYDPLTGDSRGGDVGPGAIRAMIETCADRITGAGVAMYRLPSPGPVCPDAKPAPDQASPHLRRLSRTLLQVGPARHRRRAALSYRVRVWALPPIHK